MKKYLAESRCRTSAIRLLLIVLTILMGSVGEFVIGLVPVKEVNAYQNDVGNCKAIDVVILIDQSDSMREANDPNSRRFEAAETIITYLGNHAVWLCQDQDIQHRVTVVGFGDTTGDDVSIYLNNQIVPPVNDFISWKADRGVINSQVDSGKSDSLGATNHYAALTAANEILIGWRNNPITGAPRRQAVVIITDGEPCLLARGCGQGEYYDIRQDMTDIMQLTGPDSAEFPWRGADNPNSVFLSLITMSKRSGDFQQQFVTDWETITRGHGSDVFSANDANTNLNTIVTDIMTPITGSGFEAVSCNQDIWVEPYVDNLVLIYAFGLADDAGTTQRAVLHIDTGNEDIEVQGGTASSNEVQITEYIPDDRNEFYVFAPPVPGKYRIALPDTGDGCESLLNIRLKRTPITYEVSTPNEHSTFPAIEPPNVDVAEKFRVAVFASTAENDLEKSPLKEFDDYPLNIAVTITNPDGNLQDSIALQKVQDGIYESPEIIHTPVPGTYEWSLVASVNHPDEQQEDIIVFTESGKFMATPISVMEFQITKPDNGRPISSNAVQGSQQLPIPIPISVSFVLNGEEPIPVLSVLSDTSNLFTASLLSGSTTYETISLTLKPNSDNEFVGEFANQVSGQILPSGNYTIQVNANWDVDKYDPLKYAPGMDSDFVNFQQTVIVPLDLVILPPAASTLHQDDWRANMLQGGRFQPFDFQIEVINAIDGMTVNLSDVLADSAIPVHAAVVPPSGDPMPVPLRLLSNETFQQFLGENIGTDINEEGEYQIKLQTAGITLQEGYAWAAPEQSASFTRQDNNWTRPNTWRLIGIVFLFLFLLLLSTTVYFWTGGPKGSLAIVDTGTYGNPEVEAGPWRLGRMPRRIQIRNNWLKSHDIKYISVKKISSSDPDYKRAVHVTAVGRSGQHFFEGDLYPDQPVPFVESGEIVYK